MGKRIIPQARGKGGPNYRSPSFRFKGEARHRKVSENVSYGMVVDLVKCRGHSAPLAMVEYDDEQISLMIAPEGIKVGDMVTAGSPEGGTGSLARLQDLPDGALVYNIEGKPGDGGKFCRSAGTYAKIVSKSGTNVVVQLPSKRKKVFNQSCRANMGVISGGGRLEKPLLKAGRNHHKFRVKNKLYPQVSGASMNAVDHPFGNKRSSRKSNARVAPRNAPPGRKVGMVRAKRTGRSKK